MKGNKKERRKNKNLSEAVFFFFSSQSIFIDAIFDEITHNNVKPGLLHTLRDCR